jgi:DNA-binding beta-propeller fold protein YncE
MFRSLRRIVLSSVCLVAALSSAHANVVVVLNSRDATVQLLDQASYKTLSTFPVGKEPHHLMATPDNKSLIVASSVGNELVFLDPKTGQVQRTIKDILDPYQIGFSPDQKWFVVTSLRLDRVDIYKFDGKTFTLSKRLPLPKLRGLHHAAGQRPDQLHRPEDPADQVDHAGR